MNPKEKKITFNYNGQEITIQCRIDENLFVKLSNTINKGLENMTLLYNGNLMKEEDFDLKIVKEDDIKILIIDFEFERKEKRIFKTI